MAVHPNQARLLSKLLQRLNADGPALLEEGVKEVDVSTYRCPERFAAERGMLRRIPMAVAQSTDLAEPMTCLTRDECGVSVLLTRDRAGEVRGFLNACRHRGTTLLNADSPCRKKAIVCPYHAWTYGLDGGLQHVPVRESFPGLELADRGLVEVPTSERHGLIWVTATPGADHDVDRFLGPLGEDLAALDLDAHVLFRRSDRTSPANWKFLIEAFLENYHIRRLHRDTVGGFFLDAMSVFEAEGGHLRTASARKLLRDHEGDVPDDVSHLMTVSLHLFPWTMIIAHPGFYSRLTIVPIGPSQMRFIHDMLVPQGTNGAEDADRWERSFELLDGGVFGNEDVVACEAMQRGLETGANTSFTFGELETAAVWFHDALDAALATPEAASEPAQLRPRG